MRWLEPKVKSASGSTFHDGNSNGNIISAGLASSIAGLPSTDAQQSYRSLFGCSDVSPLEVKKTHVPVTSPLAQHALREVAASSACSA